MRRTFCSLFLVIALITPFSIALAEGVVADQIIAESNDEIVESDAISTYWMNARLPVKCYARYSSGRITTYNYSNLTSVWGYIDCNSDEIWITRIVGNAAYGSYPTSRGRISRWFKLSDVLAEPSREVYSFTASGRINAYRWPGSSYYGYASAGDKVYVLSSPVNGYVQALYHISGTKYDKITWIPKSSVPDNNITIGNQTSGTDVDKLARQFMLTAYGQCGVQERNGVSKYGTEFGNPRGDWCGYFVMWAAKQSGVYGDRIKWLSYIPYVRRTYGSRFVYRSTRYMPMCGDLVIFDNNRNGTPDHIGIVDWIDGSGRVCYIDGNTGSPSIYVKYHSVWPSDSRIYGYVKFRY